MGGRCQALECGRARYLPSLIALFCYCFGYTNVSLPSPPTAASILNPAATCFSPMLLESGDLSPCRPLSVNSMDTTNEECADTTDTESVGSGSDVVTICRSHHCAYTEDSDGSGNEGQCSLDWCGICQYHICCKCVESGGHNRHKWILKRRSMEEYCSVVKTYPSIDPIAAPPPPPRYNLHISVTFSNHERNASYARYYV